MSLNIMNVTNMEVCYYPVVFVFICVVVVVVVALSFLVCFFLPAIFKFGMC